jgi:hypothetical protein
LQERDYACRKKIMLAGKASGTVVVMYGYMLDRLKQEFAVRWVACRKMIMLAGRRHACRI